jgi:hypothetical protein
VASKKFKDVKIFFRQLISTNAKEKNTIANIVKSSASITTPTTTETATTTTSTPTTPTTTTSTSTTTSAMASEYR